MVNGPSILNDSPKVLEGPQLLHNLIDFGVNSDACAVDFSSQGRRLRYTYREIQSCVLSLAFRIQKALSVCRDAMNLTSPRQHVVPILLPQSPALYIAQLAILESGGAFCPVNLDAPKERIKFVVGDVAANLIITTPEFKHAVSWENGPKVLLINDFPPIPSEASPRGATLREPNGSDLAYVMYTSGSSGIPKGVAVSHFAVSQSLLAHETHIPPFERFLQFAAPSFDVSVFEIFFPLKRGSTLVGCDRSQLLDNLPGMINELQVDAAELTPTVVGSLLQNRANAPGLKLLLTIGEMLTRPIVEEFGGSETKESILYGMYGPTEAAIHCTINPNMRASSSPGNIGVPFDTVSAFIAADSSTTDEGWPTVLTTGQHGELVLGGSQLAQGYLNREEQNKAAFIQTGGRNYYRTGDKARLLADGTLEILGRMNAGQVKIRGQRVELGEIEEAVYKHPGIKTASATVISSVLVVFALVNDQTIGPDHVLKTCSEWLPKFMIPNEIILLQTFPYLPSGKVDKRKLESDYQKRRQEDENHIEFSATATQSIVREILEELLGSFSKNIRLAAMGLDSLAAIQVASRLRLSGFNITTVAVLQAETPEELARFCEKVSSALPEPSKRRVNQKTGNPIATQSGNLADIEYTMPCTPLQSAMLSETAINMSAYRNWVELDLCGINDDHKVISALHALAQCNSILRTGFAESQDAQGYVQIIWRTFEGSQIENVEDFDYNFDPSKDTTLHRPLRVQIRHLASSTRLLIHIHHALYDGWSLELLLDDLDTLLMRKEPAIRPSFALVVDGYMESRISPDSWFSKDYWKDHLAHLDLRQLPNFHSRKLASRSLAISKLQTSILTSEVETAAKSLSSSPQSLFQAAYALLLSSYLGSPDICFGTVFSGRTLPIAGIEDIVGPCLSTLPIRVDISSSVTLKDLVQELNSTNRKHLQHSAVPLREIKSASQVHPSQSLFDTLIIWQQTLHKYDHTRNHVSLVDSSDNLEFNLTLEVIPGPGNVVLKANYHEALLPKSQVDLLLRQVEQLSRLIVEKCTTSLQDAFSHLSNDVLSLVNENPQSALRAETLASPVERIAVEDPGRTAIAFASSISEEDVELQQISYLELNSRSNQIGQRLLLESVLPDELVCICMDKCIDLYASILSTAKVGVGYLPLTPDTPLERLIYVLREARVAVVIAQSSSRSTFESCTDVNVIYVEEINFSLLSSENIPLRSSPKNISYCVFTSGSTGTPKGVLVTQGNLLTNLDTLEEFYPITKNSRVLQSCSQAFDVSVFEIFFSWRIGACLCSATKDVLFRDIENAIRLLHVTHLSLTPTVAALVDPKNVPNVEFLVTAGEAVTQKVFSAWAGKGLFQGYGPSETTNICTVNPRVSPDDFINNIGPPLKNTSAFVVSPGPEFAVLPRGAEGEFCFGGSQVFRGYIDRSQEAGKIINHPKFGRVYRSGDFGRLMPDGSLTFIGRKDDQVKIRGQRVELGEINAIMLRPTEVQDCITMVVSSANDSSQRVVCFWTSQHKTLNSLKCLSADASMISELYDNLESALPGYMIPSALIPLSFLPSTSQGKIDKRALLRLYKTLDVNYLDSVTRASRPSSDHEWTDLELTIAKELSRLSGLPSDKINRDTSFFNLGIDSVSAISFSRILHQTTKFRVEISDILKYSSTRRLAERLSCRTNKTEELIEGSFNNFDFGFEKGFLDSTILRFGKEGKEVQNILPCTPLQEAMLSAGEASSDKLYANKVIFNISCDVERLQTCWQNVVQRHEILRTCFIRTEIPQYAYAQVVLKEFHVTFGTAESIDNPGLATSEFEPPYSFLLVPHPGTMKLLFSMHHALYDGVALSILYEEIEVLYHGHSLPSAPSFVPFLHAATLTKTEHSDKFWSKTLENVMPSQLPHINHQLPYPRSSTRIQRLHSNSSLSWIEESTRRHNTTLLAVCHAVWASLIAELLNVSDVCFGNVVSGRTVAVQGIERLVAPCFNTIPIRLRDVHKLSYLEAFRTLQSLNADALSFQLTPLRRIQSRFSPDGSRLFDTLFILQQSPRNLDPSIWAVLEDNTAMDLPLVCEVIPQNNEDTLEIILHSHCSVIDANDALALLDSFSTRLQAALENPRRQLLSSNVKEQMFIKSLKKENTVVEVNTSDRESPEMSTSELRLRDVFSSFAHIHISKIGRDVSIFKLGLDSISAVQIAAILRKQGHGIKSSDILEHPTIAKLSAYLSAKQNNSVKDELEYDFRAFDTLNRPAICLKNNIASDQVEAIRPCTAIQQGMIAQSIHSHGQQYVNSLWLDFPPNLSLSAFKDAWRTVCNGHEMLRTGFSATDDPEHPFAMITYVKDCLELPWSESPDSFSNISIVTKLARPPWGLVTEQEDNRKLVQFIAHHALYDAQSIRMILSDVANAYYSRHVFNRQSISHLLGSILRDGEDNISAKKQFWEGEENKIIVNRFPDLTPLRVLNSAVIVREMFSQASVAQLEEFCRNIGVTMQAAGQAAWARLLSSYIGESSTTFGMALSGRSVHTDADTISFPSLVTVPVRCDVAGTNEELLIRTMNSNILLHKHQFTPLTSIQKWSGHPEGKIFDTLFAFQKLPDQTEVEFPWKIVREEASVDYAISLEVQPAPSGQVALILTFKDDILPVEHADLLLRQYDALLLDTLRNPLSPCDVAPDTGSQLLSITPAKERELPGPVTLLHEFVERGAHEWPGRKALEFASRFGRGVESRSWTYSELNKEGNKVAQILQQLGVSQGQIIAIYFDKCAEASFAIIGILKAGCSYVALDPNAPVDRLKFIVQDSGANIVLSAGESAKNIKEWMGNKVIPLDTHDIFQGCASEKPNLYRCIQPTDTSYCLYTSGTTGTPKGCLISHENAVQAMLSFQRLFAGHWDTNSRWLQFASFHFDVSVLEQFWSWSVGICVVSAPRDLIFEDIPTAIRQLRITHIDLTPSLAQLLHPDDAPSLCQGVFITGGEQLKQEILDNWGEHACIYNGYGPTEATIGVTMYPRVPKNGKPANIGPQFDNVGSFVLKPGTALPVLRGGVGELCVSGKLVGKGYLNRPDLTSERFPTLEMFEERVYRTGDLVRILHDGSFSFLGRADDQVKLRGQRLELSEINEVVKKSTRDLQEVVTLVLKHSCQQKEQLITFFVSLLRDSLELGRMISRMRYACKARLPGYMVPTHFVPIKALPLNANNKADVRQLAALYNNLNIVDLHRLSNSTQQEKEWTKSENKVLSILAQALHVDVSALARDSTIFQLGLDSISIIGFSRTLKDAGLGNANLSVVKSNPAVEELVRALLSDENPGQKQENEHVAAVQNISVYSQKHIIGILKDLGIENTEVESIAPCTPVQEGMIYRFLQSERPLYFNIFEFCLGEQVDVEKLLTSWKSLISHLQILRTKFVETDDGYAQVVLRKIDINWGSSMVDYDTVEKGAALKAPYYLILKPGSEKNIVLRIFHGLYDGNSLPMILQRLVDEYSERDVVDYGPPFHSSLAYGPLASVAGAQEFWTKHLQNWRHMEIPLKSVDAEMNVSATHTVRNLDGLEAFRKQFGTTQQAIIQAAWMAVLQAIASPDLTVGMVISGRAIDFEGAEKVIGPLFNTVPFHSKIEPGMTAASLISICHKFNMQMQDFQHTPLKDIQKWASAKPGLSLFDTLFVFQRPEANTELFANEIWSQVDNGPIADYPLAFEAILHTNGNLIMTIVAQGSVLNKSDAGALLNRMENMLLVILAKNGENTILDMSNNQNSQTTHVPQSKSVGRGPPADESRKFKNSPFLWTKESQCIRTELASLSNVEEANIREDSSIFELGLDSIDVIKLSSRLKKQGIIISVSTIIKCQNISNMASNALIKEGGDPDTDASSGRYTKELGRDMSLYLAHQGKIPFDCMTVLPATPLQQTMVNEMLKSNFTRYFNLEAFVLDSGTDPRRLAEAVQSVASKSPILRTSFIELDDPRSPVAYAQVVLNDHACVTESKGSSLDSILTNFKAKSAAIAASSGLLFQVQIITAGKSNYMIWAISHALYDGASLRLLHLDVEQAYNRRFTARPDYRPFLDQIFKSSTEEGRSFWRNTLSNLPRAVFPRKDPSQVSDTATVHRLEKRSNVSLKDIEKLCKSSRVTPQTVGQTCWAILLAHLMGQLDVVFGTVLSCRDTEESNEIMFPLMNTVAVRSVLHGTLIDMLRYMQDMSDTTRQFQHFPLGTAQALALASHNGDHAIETTLFDTLFIYQGRRPVLHGTPLYESVFGVSDVEFPVCVEMEVINDHLSWTVACKPVAGNAIETEKIIEMLDATLERIIFTPEAPTIVSDADGGISICGWPKFRMSDMSTTRPSNSPLKSVDGKWSHTELVLRKAFHEVSGVSEHLIHKNTTIFQLGLDSIVILKIPALLRRDGIKLSVADILKDQTITCMTQSALHQDVNQKAAVVTDQFQLDALSLLDPSTFQSLEKEIGDIQSIVPVTPGQLYVIRMWQASWGILFYPSFTYSLNGSVDRIRLESAWVNLLRHHDILRTGFIETKAGTLQIIFRNPTHYSIHHVTAPQEKSEELFHGASKIDLRRPPLALAVEWSGSFATKVQLTIHHALYDGISLPILMEQLQFLYQGQNLPPAMSFKAFVAQSMSVQKQNSSKGPPGWKLAQDQWSSYLNRSSHQIQVATDTSFDDDDKRTEVFQPTRQVGPLRQLAQDIGISVDALLLATVSKVYAQLLFKDEHRTVTSDVVFGIYLANRAPFGEDLSALAAPTLNILPLRISNPTGREIASIAMEIQQDLRKISSSEMSCSSLEEIYEWTGVRVNFVVNILKNTVPDVETSNDIMFKPIQDMAQKAQVVGYSPNKSMPSVNGKSDAYLPSIDVEIMFRGDTVDMGVFAPANMLSIDEARSIIKHFIELLV